MLHEDKNVRQIQGDPPRRWFSDDFFDLIVWFAPDGSVHGFQLCYDPNVKPRAITWRRNGGYTHNAIDDGDMPGEGHKSSPVLIPDGFFASDEVSRKFEAAAAELPADIRELALEKLRGFDKKS